MGITASILRLGYTRRREVIVHPLFVLSSLRVDKAPVHVLHLIHRELLLLTTRILEMGSYWFG